ncbi:MAG: MFS transporter [Burkholderiales bacterium]|nr:MFS transporter [Burkholderiales bacterium]
MNTVSAASALPGARTGSFREVWLVTLGHGLTHWYPATFYILLPLIGSELGLSYSQIGLVMSCQAIAGAVSNVPGGIFVDTVGRKGFLLALSLFWIGFPYLLMGFTHEYWMLLACVSLVGIGNNLWHPAAIPTLANRFPERKGLVLSLHGMGGNVGDAVAPLAIGALLAWLSWREIVMLNLAPGVVIACLILVYLGTWRLVGEESAARSGRRPRTARQFGSDLVALLRSRAMAALLSSSMFRSMTQSALLTFLPVFLAREMGFSPFAVGACLFVMQAAGVAAAPVAGHLSDRIGPRRIMMTSMAMTAALLFLMAVAGASPAFVFFVSVLGFFLYSTRAVLQAWMLDSAPATMGGTSIGILFGAQSLGSAVSPALAGAVADGFGLGAAFYYVTVTIVVANLLLFVMPRGSGAVSRPAG